jgi:hypothetical protein
VRRDQLDRIEREVRALERDAGERIIAVVQPQQAP